jgi:hypothetical protein
MSRLPLTLERLRTVIHYDPLTGVFEWTTQRNNHRALPGTSAGHYKSKRKYVIIGIYHHNYFAHRIAWLYMTGEMPTCDIDHINGDRADNRWANLRLATRSQNNANAKRRADNTSGFKGVTFNKRRNGWQAQIKLTGRNYNLGCFITPEEAHAAYRVAAAERFGQFARAS